MREAGLAVGIVALMGVAAAQNHITNGDFEAGKNIVAPWKFAGKALNPLVDQNRVTGTEKDPKGSLSYAVGTYNDSTTLGQEFGKLTAAREYVVAWDEFVTVPMPAKAAVRMDILDDRNTSVFHASSSYDGGSAATVGRKRQTYRGCRSCQRRCLFGVRRT